MIGARLVGLGPVGEGEEGVVESNSIETQSSAPEPERGGGEFDPVEWH